MKAEDHVVAVDEQNGLSVSVKRIAELPAVEAVTGGIAKSRLVLKQRQPAMQLGVQLLPVSSGNQIGTRKFLGQPTTRLEPLEVLYVVDPGGQPLRGRFWRRSSTQPPFDRRNLRFDLAPGIGQSGKRVQRILARINDGLEDGSQLREFLVQPLAMARRFIAFGLFLEE